MYLAVFLYPVFPHRMKADVVRYRGGWEQIRVGKSLACLRRAGIGCYLDLCFFTEACNGKGG
ncbi:hypothetical protein CHM34_14745 [Paludifilum halophilum]|uniref:Uncharacterized protein n=1 Tax=Paludifilum halophilum TaxID=1642702 RepID=A0A235B3C1_9BACL|nr:hypothetical protein CHM34_14745 [Paludifilum halophilum]